ncbi:hypothetical protein ABPG72_015763 [Tetrahymena utriculariae]
MPQTVFMIEEHFQLALLSVVLYSFEMILVGFLLPGRIRGKIFNKDFLQAHFGEEHRQALGAEIDKTYGYPDMGHGRYSDKLSYKEWVYFGKAQRAHYNFLEAWGPQTLFIIVGALKYPLFSAILGFVAILGRLLYSIGYMLQGGSTNPIRSIGAVTGDIVLLISFILSCIACISAY